MFTGRGQICPSNVLSSSETIASDGCVLVLALGPDGNLGSLLGGQHHHAHDALAIDPIDVAFGKIDLGLELRRRLHQERGWTSVDTQWIVDGGRLFNHYLLLLLLFFCVYCSAQSAQALLVVFDDAARDDRNPRRPPPWLAPPPGRGCHRRR